MRKNLMMSASVLDGGYLVVFGFYPAGSKGVEARTLLGGGEGYFCGVGMKL